MLQYGEFFLNSWDGAQIHTRALLLFLVIILNLFHGGQGKVIVYTTVTEQTFSQDDFIQFTAQLCKIPKVLLKVWFPD